MNGFKVESYHISSFGTRTNWNIFGCWNDFHDSNCVVSAKVGLLICNITKDKNLWPQKEFSTSVLSKKAFFIIVLWCRQISEHLCNHSGHLVSFSRLDRQGIDRNMKQKTAVNLMSTEVIHIIYLTINKIMTALWYVWPFWDVTSF